MHTHRIASCKLGYTRTERVVMADPWKAELEAHGSAGLAQWLAKLGFDAVHAVPPQACPWQLDPNAPPSVTAASILEPLRSSAPAAVATITAACRGLCAAELHGSWLLLYGLVRARGALILAGGPPNPSPAVPEAHAKYGWRVPEPLASFYAVHDGFGRLHTADSFWFEESVLPTGALLPLGELVPPGEEDLPYDAGDLLMVSPDGGGNLRCFHRSNPADANPNTVLWAGSDHSLSAALPFWTYFDALFRDLEKR